MSFYTDAAADAKELLAEFGQAATWSHDNGDSVFDPILGTYTGGTTTAYTANGVLLDFETSRINGSSILATDKMFLMEAGNKPEVGDILTIDSIAHKTIKVPEINPAGTPVVYEVQLRI